MEDCLTSSRPGRASNADCRRTYGTTCKAVVLAVQTRAPSRRRRRRCAGTSTLLQLWWAYGVGVAALLGCEQPPHCAV